MDVAPTAIEYIPTLHHCEGGFESPVAFPYDPAGNGVHAYVDVCIVDDE
jgi:hypothetical protein